ncbi:phage head spike fiber domain-containing protein [Serratia ureilytica]|uniref:phage head spike fiber domain-containing protein n=1 Tax=Serratia ureilytica TaxID=300181 RepID=UPI0018D6D5E5|nr:hypothetical protein [Serratia ureilytica]MBH2756489.1 hypothetical protein [Serratia ureilytica]
MSANIISFDDQDYTNYLYVIPTKEFDFTSGSIKSIDGSISLMCGRTTTARQFNENGDVETISPGVVRFKRNPLTGKIIGLLAEPSATNVLSYNGQLTNSYWTPHNCTITQSAVSGLDGIPMFKLADDAVNTYHGLPSPTTSIQATGWASGKVYAKAAENSHIFVEIGFPGGGITFNVTVNLNDGTFATGGTANGVAKTTSCKNGIYLIELSAQAASVASQTVRLSILNHNGVSQIYAGTPGNGVYIQYPQLELTPRSTSTIITANGPGTRDADNYYFMIPAGFDSTDMSICAEVIPTSLPLAAYAAGEVTSGVLALRDSNLTGSASVRALIGRQISSLLPQAFARTQTSNISLLGKKKWQLERMLIAYSTAGILSSNGDVVSANPGFVQSSSNSVQVGSSRPDAEYFDGVVTGLLLYQVALSADDLGKVTQQ